MSPHRPRTPRILVVDDEPDIRAAIDEILRDEGYEVVLASSAAEARREAAARRPDLVLLDIWMEGEDGISLLKDWARSAAGVPPVLMMSGHGTVDTAVEATRLGALDFIEKPVSLAKLLYIVEQTLKSAPRRREPLGAAPLLDLIASHPAIAHLKQALEAVRGHTEPVLLVGESGTGRETLARQLARNGRREFSRITLAGADTADVRARVAKFTEPALLYLAELGDASPEVQEELLALATVRTDDGLRLVASIQPSLVSGAPQGQLRRELYDRLAVFTIEVPPLREYRDYLPEIVRYYVDELAGGEGYHFRRFDVAALNRLHRYDWPGNLRELNNLLKQLLASGSEEPVGLGEVDAVLAGAAPSAPRLGEDLLSLPYREARERFERAYLEAQLELVGGKVASLAERIGLERTHVYRKLKALDIELPSDEKRDTR